MAGVKGMHRRASTSPAYAEAIRARIQTGVIVDRLVKHSLGKVRMSATEVQAATVLLKKVVPDLSATELSGSIETKTRLVIK